MKRALVLWFTGLSGSGKTTISREAARILEERGRSCLMLDGDEVRSRIHHHLGFSREDIVKNNGLIMRLCEEERSRYDFIFVPIISPFASSRQQAREILGDGFAEVYIECGAEELKRRDPKGLYEKSRKGQIKNLIGFSEELPYEAPVSPEITLRTDKLPLNECVNALIQFIK